MLTYEEALRKILECPFTPTTERVPLMDSEGRYLSESIAAPWPLPRFDNSAMDGFAVHARDTREAGLTCPVTLDIVGESAAGAAFDGKCAEGSAIRISTGAEMPDHLDGIVPIEKCEVEGEKVKIFKAATSGQYIRRRGEDVAESHALFGVGTKVSPAVLSFLASYNIEDIPVFVRPKVAILSSGDEIRPFGSELTGSQIVGSSSYYLERELAACGCETRDFGISPDNVDAYTAMFEEALSWGDIVVTTAGVSMGEHDVVGNVTEKLGGELLFWKAAIRPGKPIMVTRFGDKIHFGLPGNPVSTCCNTEVFLKPFLRRAFNCEPYLVPRMNVKLADACPRDKSRLFFVYSLAYLEDGETFLRPLSKQSSGNLYNPAQANALAVIEPGDKDAPKKSMIEMIPIRCGL